MAKTCLWLGAFVLLAACGGEELIDPPDDGACAPAGLYSCTCMDESSTCSNDPATSYYGSDAVEASNPVCSIGPVRKVDSGWFEILGCQARRWDETSWLGPEGPLESYRHSKVSCPGVATCEIYTRCTCDKD